jgi:hypothetical protein
MNPVHNTILSFALVASAVFLASSSFALEPESDSPAGPEPPALTYDRPIFLLDDEVRTALDRGVGGTDLRAGPDVIVPEDDMPSVLPPAVPEP